MLDLTVTDAGDDDSGDEVQLMLLKLSPCKKLVIPRCF